MSESQNSYTKSIYYTIPFRQHSGKDQTIGTDIRTVDTMNQRLEMGTECKRKEEILGSEENIVFTGLVVFT